MQTQVQEENSVRDGRNTDVLIAPINCVQLSLWGAQEYSVFRAVEPAVRPTTQNKVKRMHFFQGVQQ